MSPVVVPTGTANLASVLAAFARLGEETRVARDSVEVERARHVVLPGVGSFSAAARELDGFRETLVGRITEGRPTLAICVGMQLLARRSDEGEDVDGLGVIDLDVGRFPGSVRVPQLGWNRVRASSGCRFVSDGWAYFANSFRLSEPPAGWSAAMTDHGGEFVSALERDRVLACQFHPELSGAWGSAVLARWLGRER